METEEREGNSYLRRGTRGKNNYKPRGDERRQERKKKVTKEEEETRPGNFPEKKARARDALTVTERPTVRFPSEPSSLFPRTEPRHVAGFAREARTAACRDITAQ